MRDLGPNGQPMADEAPTAPPLCDVCDQEWPEDDLIQVQTISGETVQGRKIPAALTTICPDCNHLRKEEWEGENSAAFDAICTEVGMNIEIHPRMRLEKLRGLLIERLSK